MDFDSTSRELTIGNARLHYHEAGSGPPLILLHGSGPGVYGWANFSGNLPVFAQHFRCFIIDMPGYGRSSAVAGNPIDAAIASTRSFMDALGLAQAGVLGNSLGGIVASRLAAEHPERVSKLCMIGGIGLNLFTSFPNEGINLLVEFSEQPSSRAARGVAALDGVRPGARDGRAHRGSLAPCDRPDHARSQPANLLARRDAGARGDTVRDAALATPAEDPVSDTADLGSRRPCEPARSRILPMRIIPKCELHTFHDCGHWVMIERKLEFESVTLAFFQRS